MEVYASQRPSGDTAGCSSVKGLVTSGTGVRVAAGAHADDVTGAGTAVVGTEHQPRPSGDQATSWTCARDARERPIRRAAVDPPRELRWWCSASPGEMPPPSRPGDHVGRRSCPPNVSRVNVPRSSCLIQMPRPPVASPTPIARRRPSGDRANELKPPCHAVSIGATAPSRVTRTSSTIVRRGGALHVDQRSRWRPGQVRGAVEREHTIEHWHRRPRDPEALEIERRRERRAVAAHVEQMAGRQVPGRHHAVEQEPLAPGAQVQHVHASSPRSRSCRW